MEYIAEIHSLSYAYRGHEDKLVLQDINLEIRRGEFLALAGRTGSGKSTLCYAINGFVPHSFGGKMEGEVHVCGLNTRQATIAALARKVGMVLQSAESQLVGLTVEEDVQFGLENLALPVEEIEVRTRWALEVVRLTDYRSAPPWSLSGGQKQRVAIAATLAFRPEILILDNPTAELDPVGKEEVLETIARLNQELGVTIVMVDQELHEITPYADRLVILDDGRIILSGTPQEVLDQATTVRKVGVKLPDMVEVGYQLRKDGLWEGPLVMSVEEMAAEVEALCGKRDATYVPAQTPNANRQEAEVLIQIEGLHFAYPGASEVLKGIDLTIRRGEFVALMGPNGAGKTTLAKHLNGLLKPTAGSVIIHGLDTRERTVAEMATRIGYVFQNPDHQIFSRTVGEELAYGVRNLGWPEERIREAVAHTLADLDMLDAAEAEPFFLGLAQRKLIAIGSVLIMEPEVLVLDEPATGADYGVALQIMRYICELHRRGLTIIIITHDVSLAANYADRLLVMRDGRIVLDGPPRAVFREREALRASYVTSPQVAELARALNGVGLPPDIITVSEMVSTLRRILGKEQSCGD